MNEDNLKSSMKPFVAPPGPHSIDGILRHVDQAPDEETERFVQAIYEDRRKAAASPSE